MPEGGYKEVKIGELFVVKTPKKKFNANEIAFGGSFPYVARGSSNNGIKGYVNLDIQFLNEGNTLSFGQDTATIYYQKEPYFTGDKIKVLKPQDIKLEEKIACYMITSMRKAFKHFSWGSTSFSEDVIKSVTISLPVNKEGKIDFEFMRSRMRELEEQRMRELEEQRMRELEAYLFEAGFENCELTEEEKTALLKFQNNAVTLNSFTIGDIYNRIKISNRNFDKRKDTSKIRSDIFSVPLINAKVGDNGIMFYGKPEIFQSFEMSIDIIQNGAIATGNVYAQPQKTGVLWDAYLIKANFHKDTENTLLYISRCIQKQIKLKFNRDQKATWDRVRTQNVILPVKSDGSIDLGFIETFISATKKLVIQNLMQFINDEKKAYTEIID